MLRVSILILPLLAEAVTPQRAVSSFTWQVVRKTATIEEIDTTTKTAEKQIYVISSAMESVFNCPDMINPSIPHSSITQIVRSAFNAMSATGSIELPDSLLELRDPKYNKALVCGELLKKLNVARAVITEKSFPKMRLMSSIAWYESAIAEIQKSVWSPSSSQRMDYSVHLIELVEAIERYRDIVEIDDVIRGVITHNRERFESIVKDETLRSPTEKITTNVAKAVDAFVANRNVQQYTHSMLGLYMRHKEELHVFETFVFRAANMLTNSVKTETCTRILNLENRLMRGFVYTKRMSN